MFSGVKKNKVGTFVEENGNSVSTKSKIRGRGQGKVSPETLVSSKSVFDLSEGFSKPKSRGWKLRKSVSA